MLKSLGFGFGVLLGFLCLALLGANPDPAPHAAVCVGFAICDFLYMREKDET